MKKVITFLVIVAGLTFMSSTLSAQTLDEAFNKIIIRIEQTQGPERINAMEKVRTQYNSNLTNEETIKVVSLCDLWLNSNPIWKMQGLTSKDCTNLNAPWSKMQQDFLPSLKFVDENAFKARDIINFDPYDVGNGKFVSSFMGKIIQRINKNSYILLGTNINGQEVPFYLTNVPAGNYQIGAMYMGYTQKGQPYKYKAANGALQIVNAGNKVYSITEFPSMEKMIRSGM